MKTLCTRILMAPALMGALLLTATMTSEAAETQADVFRPGVEGRQRLRR